MIDDRQGTEMTNALREKSWSPYVVGALIGVLTWFAFASVDKPIGVSTPFEHSAALLEKAAAPNVENTNVYFEMKAAEGKSPKIGWEWMLVLGVFVGGFISSKLSGDRGASTVPRLWAWRFGGSTPKRLVAAFGSGAIMMFGARLAQGCTSGHGISGTLQLALSSWLFIIVAFSVATATTMLLYGRQGWNHV
jgi:uncharacterized protein